MAWNTQYIQLHMFVHFFIHIAYILYTYSHCLHTLNWTRSFFFLLHRSVKLTLLTIENCMRVAHKILCRCIIFLLFPICNVQGFEYIERIHWAQRAQKKRESEINMQVLITELDVNILPTTSPRNVVFFPQPVSMDDMLTRSLPIGTKIMLCDTVSYEC